MIGIIKNLTKATIGAVIETPIAIVADFVTLGGVLTDKHETYTSKSIKGVMENIESSTKRQDY